ncbi:hypothetical protein SLE2022_358240 [Rubroshorea leprosula]
MSSLRSIRLGNYGLFGEFSRAIFQLPKLQVLAVSYNLGLTGLLLPSLCNLTKLQSLTLDNNSFTGIVEINTFLEFKYLKHLFLFFNNFSLIFKTRNGTNTIFAKLKKFYDLDPVI